MTEAVHRQEIAVGIPAIAPVGLQRDVLLMISLRGTACHRGVGRTVGGTNGLKRERCITEKSKTAYLEE